MQFHLNCVTHELQWSALKRFSVPLQVDFLLPPSSPLSAQDYSDVAATERPLTSSPDLNSSPSSPPTVLSIAGFDPSAGAGVLADLKTFAAVGVYGMACITALTVQSTQGVRRVVGVDTGIVIETLDCLVEDACFSAIKVGMLGHVSMARPSPAGSTSGNRSLSYLILSLDPAPAATCWGSEVSISCGVLGWREPTGLPPIWLNWLPLQGDPCRQTAPKPRRRPGRWQRWQSSRGTRD